MTVEVFWNDAVSDYIRRNGIYEPETVHVLSRYLTPRVVFIDIGAHVGQYTMLAAGFGAQVHSFEPDPRTFALLRRNVLRNDLHTVALNNWALSDAQGQAPFVAGAPDNVGRSALCVTPDASSHTVRCDTLDRYVQAHNLRQIGLIKIDVEGAELMVLRGAKDVLHERPPLIVEFADKWQRLFEASNSDLAAFLRHAGYDLFRICSNGLVPYRPSVPEDPFFNVLCLACPG